MQRVGDRAAGVVVRVDAERRIGLEAHHAHRTQHLVRHRAPVGVAEHDGIRTGVGSGTHDFERVAGVVRVAVEEVLGVEEDRASLRLEVRDRVAHHAHVLLEGGAKRLGHVDVPRLAEDADRLAPGVEQRAQAGVFLGGDVLAARHPECGDRGRLELQVAGALEELDVLGVGAGESALDVVDAEQVETLGDAQLVLDREREPLALRAVS
jgi:hypothetical protein